MEGMLWCPRDLPDFISISFRAWDRLFSTVVLPPSRDKLALTEEFQWPSSRTKSDAPDKWCVSAHQVVEKS